MWALIPTWLQRAVAVLVIAIALVSAFMVWLTVHDASIRADAVKGLVTQYRATSAEAERDELQRQLNGGKVVIEAYQVQLRNARTKEEATTNDNERKIAENEALRAASGRVCTVDDLDRKFLLDN